MEIQSSRIVFAQIPFPIGQPSKVYILNYSVFLENSFHLSWKQDGVIAQ